MVQLDSLRALALFGVMVEHFVPPSTYTSFISSWKTASPIEWGSGVTLFFVLSGFLITGILLRCRDIIRANDQRIGFTLQRFYIRRFLRIFPIYYLTLVVAAIIFKRVRSDFFWHLTYTSNIMVFVQDSYDQYATHFWTLAMEEQFYLIWPLVILLLPQRYLLKAIFTTITLAPLFRFIGCYGLNLSITQIGVFPAASLDALGLGALLAFYIHNYDQFKQAKQSLCKFGLWVCLPLMISFIIISFIFRGTVLINILIKPTISSIFFVWLVSTAAKGFDGILGRFLELKPLVFIGKISYGIYIYHNFMNPIYDILSWYLNLPTSIPLLLVIALKVIASFAIAIPSWFLIEKPINNFKRHFGYEKASWKLN
ncbi:Acyltransferase [Tumidithrix helvetica PCC 7403]|uniref:acyltransferase family protein n=1 Tax=Tumidithrix helvetica TaxID=3457545 RepID=UPI003C8ED16C